MGDNGSEMTETTDYSVRFPDAFVEEELMPMFPAATKATDAIRMAVQNDLERRNEKVSSADIANSVVEALEEHGGSFETVQRLEIGSVEQMDVCEVDEMNVDE